MTYTIDDIKRLVPEATFNTGLDYWIIDGCMVAKKVLHRLLTTCRQLEIAMEALSLIDRVNAMDYEYVRWARIALDSIKKEQQ